MCDLLRLVFRVAVLHFAVMCVPSLVLLISNIYIKLRARVCRRCSAASLVYTQLRQRAGGYREHVPDDQLRRVYMYSWLRVDIIFNNRVQHRKHDHLPCLWRPLHLRGERR